MRVLALETSTLHGSIAALDRSANLREQRLLSLEQRTAQSLAPAVQQLFEDVTWHAQDIQLIAVTQGPGSFTGLRAGITLAKVLAYAAGAKVVGVNTLTAIATQATRQAPRVWAVSDAQRQQLFTALFDASASPMAIELEPTCILNREAWLERLQGGDVVNGPGLATISSQLPAGIIASAEKTWQPAALTVAQLGLATYQSAGPSDLWKLVPNYYRQSAAEERLDLR